MGFLRYFLVCTFGFGHLWEETYCDSVCNPYERPYVEFYIRVEGY